MVNDVGANLGDKGSSPSRGKRQKVMPSYLPKPQLAELPGTCAGGK